MITLSGSSSTPISPPNGTAANPTIVTGSFNYTGNDYAINLPNPAQYIVVDKLRCVSSGGVVNASGNATDVKVTGCDLKFNGAFSWFACGGKATRVTLGGSAADSNFIHDSLTTGNGRMVIVWDTQDFEHSHNRYWNCGYSMHAYGIHVNFKSYRNTYAHCKQVRGEEIQEASALNTSAGTNIVVEDTCLYDCQDVNPDTFGCSIPPQGASNVRLLNSYFSVFEPGAKFVGGILCHADGKPVTYLSGGRPGYGAECGAKGFIAKGNIFCGPWVCAIVAMRDTHLQQNKSYSLDPNGKSMNAWGTWGTEGGNFGQGNIVDEGGNQVLPFSQAPPPPRTLDSTGKLTGTWADGTPVDGSTTDTMTITNVKAVASDSSHVLVTWVATGAQPTDKVTIQRTTKAGAPDGPTIPPQSVVAGNFIDASFTADQVTNKWEFFYAVNGVKSAAPVQIGLGVTPPPPPDDPVTKVEAIGGYRITHKSGKTETVQ